MAVSTKIEDIKYVSAPPVKGVKEFTFAHIGWLQRLNCRKNLGNEKEQQKTCTTLVDYGGWDGQYPAVAEVATDDEVNELLEGRKTIHAMLKADATKASPGKPEGKLAAARLAAFEHEYLDKKGEFVRPIFIGTTGNRRGSQLLNVMGQLLFQNGLDYTIHNAMPIIVPLTPTHRFPDAAVRKQAQLRENLTKTESYKAMEESELLDSVLDLVEKGGKGQNDIRNCGFGTVLGLRMYFAAVIDIYCRNRGWKKVKFLERLTAPKYLDEAGEPTNEITEVLNPMALDFGAFDQKDFQGPDAGAWKGVAMGLMCETDEKFEKENRRRKALQNPLDPLQRPSQEKVLDWIEFNMTSVTPKVPALLKRETISNLAERALTLPARAMAKAIHLNDTSFLEPVNARASAYNAVYSASTGLYEVLGPILIGLAEIDEDSAIAILKKITKDVEKAVALAEAAEAKSETKAETKTEEKSEVEA